MPKTQTAFASPSSLVLTKSTCILLCLAAMHEAAKKKKDTSPGEHPCAKAATNQTEYQWADAPSRCVVQNVPRETFVVDPRAQSWLKFQRLVKEWRKQRGARSSITEAVAMPAYHEIMGMGDRAVPLLIAQLRSEGDQPDQWFWALRAITGENPVKPEEQGNFRKMAKAWLKWAEQNVW